MSLELFNYPYSVYGRIVRIVLAEKGIRYETREINPFAPEVSKEYLDIHPFSRVPAIRHDGFILYETAAITDYLDTRFGGPSLQPAEPAPRARMRQIISLVDNYAYLPLVRQVFSHRVFRRAFGEVADENVIAEGLAAAPRILAALELLLKEDGYATGADLSLADTHLAPMIDYFTMAEEGADMLRNYPKLNGWWSRIKNRSSILETRPYLK